MTSFGLVSFTSWHAMIVQTTCHVFHNSGCTLHTASWRVICVPFGQSTWLLHPRSQTALRSSYNPQCITHIHLHQPPPVLQTREASLWTQRKPIIRFCSLCGDRPVTLHEIQQTASIHDKISLSSCLEQLCSQHTTCCFKFISAKQSHNKYITASTCWKSAQQNHKGLHSNHHQIEVYL